MKNKEIQEKRMKDYFIQATKDILKGEGIKGISVRNIADQAGYSYATLYNYFRDVNDLIFLCVNDFQEECRLFVTEQTRNVSDGLSKLKATVLTYVQYFVEYPGIFELFYLTPVGDFGHKQAIIDVISSSLKDVCRSDWEYCLAHCPLSDEKAELIQSQLKYTVVGLLVLYLNRRIPVDYNDFIFQANQGIDAILQSVMEK